MICALKPPKSCQDGALNAALLFLIRVDTRATVTITIAFGAAVSQIGAALSLMLPG